MKVLVSLCVLLSVASVLAGKPPRHHGGSPVETPGKPPRHHGGSQVEQPPVLEKPEPVVYCYWGSWSINRPGVGAFGASDLPSDLCTHIVYSFLGLDSEGTITYDAETTVNSKSSYFADLLPLREANPDLKLLFGVGGYNEGSEDFSTVSNNDTLRATFVQNLVNITLSNQYDGVSLDWEYPNQRDGSAATDYEAFVWLLRDLKAALEVEGLQLSIGVGVTSSAIALSYNVTEVNKYVDHIVLMTYDLHGSWESVTGANAPLYEQLTDAAGDVLNVNVSVYNWLDGGADASKLLLGVGSYGRSFTLTSLDNVSTGAPASGAGAAGTYSQEAGFLAYYEICLNQLENEWNVTEVTGNYVYGNYDTLWVGYDNANTVYAKGAYAASLGLGGVSLWAIDYDDFSGQCSNETFPFTKASRNGYLGA